jgi:hypothetical protein
MKLNNKLDSSPSYFWKPIELTPGTNNIRQNYAWPRTARPKIPGPGPRKVDPMAGPDLSSPKMQNKEAAWPTAAGPTGFRAFGWAWA